MNSINKETCLSEYLKFLNSKLVNNDIPLGNMEINCIKKYSKKTDSILSIYYDITNQNSFMNMFGPSFVNYDLVILIKRNNKFMTQVFNRRRYLENMNDAINDYQPLYPYEHISNSEFMKYPLEKICRKNYFLKNTELLQIKKILFCIKPKIPIEIIDCIINFFINGKYNNNSSFFIRPIDNDNNNTKDASYKLISEYYQVSIDKSYGLFLKI